MRDYRPGLPGYLPVPGTAARTPGALNAEALWSSERLPPNPSDLTLNLATQMWLKQLPAGFVPEETAARYPRIVNRLARYWETPTMMEGVFDDLLFGKRRKREGFPKVVQAEINNLFQLFQTQRQPSKTRDAPWSLERGLRGHNKFF